MPLDLVNYAEIAREACVAPREILRGQNGLLTESAHDLKSEADIGADEVIQSVLKTTPLPIFSEENVKGKTYQDLESEVYWLVDPLDGTVNYHLGNPLYTTSIALVDCGAPVLGVIYDHGRDELYLGGVGLPTTCNGESVRAALETACMGEATLGTGFPSGRSYAQTERVRFTERLANFRKVRLLGSAALSLAWVSRGWLDAYEEKDIYFWDVAAGLALVEGAGGSISVTRNEASDWQVLARAAGGKRLLEEMDDSVS